MIIKIPQNQNFKKFNRSTCFKNNKLIRLIKNQYFSINSFYSYYLIAAESGVLSFNQLKTIFQTGNKYIKLKKRPVKKQQQTLLSGVSNVSTDNLFIYTEEGILYNLNLQNILKLIFKNRFNVYKYIQSNFKSKKKKNQKFKKTKFSFLISPRLPLTSKPLGIRMGKGKGSVDFWQVPIKKGQILIKIRKDVRVEKTFLSLKQVQYRIPFKTKVVVNL